MFKPYKSKQLIILALFTAFLAGCGGSENGTAVTPIIVSTPVVVNTPVVTEMAPATATTQPAGPTTGVTTAVPATQPATTPAPVRIQFAPGAVSASVSGEIEPNSYDQYVLSAQVGQAMRVNLAAANGQANFDLVGASDGVPYKRAMFPPTTWEEVLPMTQDYLINVSAPAGTADSYTLTVTIDPAVPESTPERIQFALGSTTATVSGVFAAGGDGRAFILTAREGQTLTIQVTANPAGPVTVFVKDATERIILTGTDGETISLNLPATGDYTVLLYTPGAAPAVTYTMVVTIP
jgi:hypothetical protein